MNRITLSLEPWQLDRLRSLAERRGRGISEIVRDILGEHLGPSCERPNEALVRRLSGIGASGSPRLAEDHDEVLYGRRRRRS